MINFLNGVATAGALGVGLFFFRLWHETRDRFFALFGAAFWALAFTWLALVWAEPANEDRHYFYLGRLLAFLLIIVAIVDKNRSSDRPRP
jgi:peptidoglycan/LPS O-acetylase OafA/YrhL